jgi:hypothetical protein
MQSDMLMVSVKPFMASVIVLNVVMLNVMATLKNCLYNLNIDNCCLYNEVTNFHPPKPTRVKHFRKAPSLTRKHGTRLERLARSKLSSLLQTIINYGHKTFYLSGPGANVIELFSSVIYTFSY